MWKNQRLQQDGSHLSAVKSCKYVKNWECGRTTIFLLLLEIYTNIRVSQKSSHKDRHWWKNYFSQQKKTCILSNKVKEEHREKQKYSAKHPHYQYKH